MRSTLPFLGILLESVSVLRTVPTPGRLQKNPPTPTPAAAEEQSMDPRGVGTCVADAPRPARCHERLRVAVPCRNTTAERVRPLKIPPNADQKTDGEFPGGRLSRRD